MDIDSHYFGGDIKIPCNPKCESLCLFFFFQDIIIILHLSFFVV